MSSGLLKCYKIKRKLTSISQQRKSQYIQNLANPSDEFMPNEVFLASLQG
jgi:hypothetical protein